ncbi:MAG TPA: hypothetical protein PLN05_16615 [Pyrinomonadaceae bacterium]|nr:hypothetical protein [Chloracidobacterium sp.]HBE82428.1 hypothetical protein [Blastocatellia bacterium]HRK52045.1 hypothetical protein [Pyrinomonadaceae bacterium]
MAFPREKSPFPDKKRAFDHELFAPERVLSGQIRTRCSPGNARPGARCDKAGVASATAMVSLSYRAYGRDIRF